jgi:sugar lactone lactonase YvrE
MSTSALTLECNIERVGTLSTLLGESPVWDAVHQRLWCVDSRAGQLWNINPRDGHAVCHTLEPPLGSLALNDDGRLVLAMRDSIALYAPNSGDLRVLARLEVQHPHWRLNDGKAMPDGSFVVGSMHVFRSEGEPPLGGIYRVDTQGQLTTIGPALGVANGPLVHPMDGRFYIADSTARRIDSFAVATDGALQDRQTLAFTTALESAPDGCCADAQGGLWTALVHAGALVRFNLAGELTHRIDLPVQHPTALCFGGPDLDQLFVTSIRDSGRLRSEGPLDGALLRLQGTGFSGLSQPCCRIQALC